MRALFAVVPIAATVLAGCGPTKPATTSSGTHSSTPVYPDDSVGALLLPIFQAHCAKLVECKKLRPELNYDSCVDTAVRAACSSGSTDCNLPDAQQRSAANACVAAVQTEACDAVEPNHFPDACPRD